MLGTGNSWEMLFAFKSTEKHDERKTHDIFKFLTQWKEGGGEEEDPR